MTVVAYRDGVLAADTRTTDNDLVEPGDFRKVYRFKDGILMGFAGNVGNICEIVRWLRKNPDKIVNFKTKFDIEAIMVKPDGHVMVLDGAGWKVRDAEYYAIGTGRDAALVAMYCGKSAKQAVEVAMQFDRNTGGKVQTVRLK